MYRRTERGEGNLGCVLWTVVLVIAVVIAWKMVPIKIKSAELQDFMDDQAGVVTYGHHTEESIKRRILAKARDLDLPLKPDDVQVQRIGDNIKMRARYTVDVKFPGYVYHWNFDHEVDRALYIF